MSRKLPEAVLVGATEWNVTEHEGLIVFRESQGLALGAFSRRYSFSRDRHSSWRVSVDNDDHRGYVSDIFGLYRVVEDAYGAEDFGATYGGKLDANGRLTGCP
jgi:hypothetical protein